MTSILLPVNVTIVFAQCMINYFKFLAKKLQAAKTKQVKGQALAKDGQKLWQMILKKL